MTQHNRDHLVLQLRQMLLIRRFEEKSAELYTAEKIRGFLHLYIGEEAVAVGVMAALTPDDAVVATYREHGQALARGLSAGAIMAEMYGKVEGCCRGRGGSMHLFDADLRFYGGNAIVAGGLPLAVGLALADRMQARANVTACFFGDGAVAEGDFHEALNLAALWQLPVLFVCENNQYAGAQRFEEHTRAVHIADRAAGYGMAGVVVDGNDAEAVYAVTVEARARALAGSGPTLIECKTYRWRGHFEGDACVYRSEKELEEWKAKDPIPRFAKKLVESGTATQAELDAITASVAAEIEAAVKFAEDSPFPKPEDLLEDVYA